MANNGKMGILQHFFDWTEVWALFIPLSILLKKRKQPSYLKPIIIYLILALLLNLLADIIGDFRNTLHFPPYLMQNTFLYNIHSIVRFACFAEFFILLQQPFLVSLKKTVPLFCIPLVIIYFLVFENFNNPKHISAYFLTAEAFLLLLYCLQYYLFRLNEETTLPKREADFWVATGLGIYVVINFFIFLFYISVLDRDMDLADKLWNIHNIAYIIFCIFLAKAFYVSD